MPNPTFLVVWEFRVALGAEARFEEIYNSTGAWAALFARDPAFHRTELHCDLSQPGRYFTLDYWTSESSYDEFHAQHRADYEALDRECENLTESEILIGRFYPVG